MGVLYGMGHRVRLRQVFRVWMSRRWRTTIAEAEIDPRSSVPSVHVSAELEHDVHLQPSTVVGAMTRIGSHTVLGSASIVDRYVDIGRNVKIGHKVQIRRSVSVASQSIIGSNVCIYENAIVGNPPQDKKYGGGPTRVVIGRGTILREKSCVERGTEHGGGLTKVGDEVLLMSNVYVGHDVQIGDRCVVGNGTSLAGHVVVEDDVTIGGHTAVHQRVFIGREAMVGGMTAVRHDVVPFTLVMGNPAELCGLNLRRLRRRRLPPRDMQILLAVYEYLFSNEIAPLRRYNFDVGDDRPNSSLKDRAATVASTPLPSNSHASDLHEIVQEMTSFISTRSSRGIHTLATPRSRRQQDTNNTEDTYN